MSAFTEGNTNFAYMYADIENRQVYTNRTAFQEYDGFEESLSALKKMGKYLIVKPAAIDFETNIEEEDKGQDGTYQKPSRPRTIFLEQLVFYIELVVYRVRHI